MFTKQQTKGMKVRLDYSPDRNPTVFMAGGRKRVFVDNGFVMVNGQVRFADGTHCYAILSIDESSSGEFYGAMVFHKKYGLVDLQTHEMTQLGMDKQQIFPYKYKYDVELFCYDHHIDEKTGWSR